MVTAEDWVLVENVTPTLDVQCLTLHPGFEACCLNLYALQTGAQSVFRVEIIYYSELNTCMYKYIVNLRFEY